MRPVYLFLAIALFLSCSTDRKIKDNEIIELPIKLLDGYGSFQPSFIGLSWSDHDPVSEWSKTQIEVIGIPEEWTESVVKQIWFDPPQFVFQNFKQGNISEEFFNELKGPWNINLNERSFSETPIKCYTHIALGKTIEGSITYKIDSNNDRDFSDEPEFHPNILTDWLKIDSLSQYTTRVSCELFLNNGIKKMNVPVLIVLHETGFLLYNVAMHAETEFEGLTIKISSGFSDLVFTEAMLSIYNPLIVNDDNPIVMNEFIKLGSNFFQNLGVNLTNQTLQLKKMSLDTILFSTQVEFMAKPFVGIDLLTGDTINMNDYRGKYLYIEFWGSWCTGCIQEISYVKSAYKNIDKSKIEFLGIPNDNLETLMKFIKKEGISWPQILSSTDNNIAELYRVRIYPTSFLINPNGKIIAKNLQGKNLFDTLSYFIN